MSRPRSTNRVLAAAAMASLLATVTAGHPADAQSDQTAPVPVQAASTVPGSGGTSTAVTTVPPTALPTLPPTVAPVAPATAAPTTTVPVPATTAATSASKATTKATTKVAAKTATTMATGAGGKAARSKAGLYLPNGRPPAAAAAYRWGLPSPEAAYVAAPSLDAARAAVAPGGKVFSALIIGSDARPGEKFTRTRGDSIHLFLFNPALGKGTLIGFPRDTYVAIPGRGQSKITSSLAWGGPALMLQTVNQLTGLNTSLYVVTGFEGFTKLVNEIGGVNVLVSPRMNEPLSGATFEEGWFRMNGDAALAYTRNRHDVANGDFGRSANQAKFLLWALAGMRERTGDPAGLLTWVNALRRNADTNVKVGDMLAIAQMVRHIDPAAITSTVVKGKPAMVKGTSVVQLDTAAFAALMGDVRTDGVIGR